MASRARLLVLAYAVCALIWGTTWYAIRVCVSPDGYPMYEALALRFGIATVILLPLALRVRPWPRRRRTWAWLALAGVLDALGYTLVYLGEQHISGGLAAVVSGVQPLLMALLLTATRSEPVVKTDLVGAAVSLLGVAFLFLDRVDVSWLQGVGLLLVFGSVVVSTLYLYVVKEHGGDTHPLVVTTVFITVTAVVLGVMVLIRGPQSLPSPLPVAPTIALLYLAIFGSVIAFATYFWLQARVSLMTTGTLVFVFPLIALLVDMVWEHNVSLGARAYAGVAITLAGLVVSLRGRVAVRRRAAAGRSTNGLLR